MVRLCGGFTRKFAPARINLYLQKCADGNEEKIITRSPRIPKPGKSLRIPKLVVVYQSKRNGKSLDAFSFFFLMLIIWGGDVMENP